MHVGQSPMVGGSKEKLIYKALWNHQTKEAMMEWHHYNCDQSKLVFYL